MSRFIILGNEEFTLGFRLAGVNDIIEVNETSVEKEIKKMIDEKIDGICVIDKKTTELVHERTRTKIEDSVKPVFVVLSETAEQENIRKMIIKAIGIDIMAKEQK